MDIKIIQWRAIELEIESVIEIKVAATSFLCMCGCCHMINVVECIGLYKQLLKVTWWETHDLNNFTCRQRTGMCKMTNESLNFRKSCTIKFPHSTVSRVWKRYTDNKKRSSNWVNYKG